MLRIEREYSPDPPRAAKALLVILSYQLKETPADVTAPAGEDKISPLESADPEQHTAPDRHPQYDAHGGAP